MRFLKRWLINFCASVVGATLVLMGLDYLAHGSPLYTWEQGHFWLPVGIVVIGSFIISFVVVESAEHRRRAKEQIDEVTAKMEKLLEKNPNLLSDIEDRLNDEIVD